MCIWLVPQGFIDLLLLLLCQELNSVLSFAGHLSDSSSDQALSATKSDQKKESTSEHSPPYQLCCCLNPHPVMLRAVVCSGKPKQDLEQQKAQSSCSPFLWRKIWLYGMVSKPAHWASLSCHSPACWHSLHVQDTLLVSPRGRNFFPIPSKFSPWITAKMHSVQQTLFYSILQHSFRFFPKYFSFW